MIRREVTVTELELRGRLDAAYRRFEGRRLRVAAARAEHAFVLRVTRATLGADLGLGDGPLRGKAGHALALHQALAEATVALAYARQLHDDSRREIEEYLALLPGVAAGTVGR